MTIMDQDTNTTSTNTGNATRARDNLINELLRDSETLQKKTTKAPTRKPASTPGGIPAIPAMSITAATATAAVGALGAATGGVGVAVLAGAGAAAAAPGVVRRARRAATGSGTRTVTKTTKTTGGRVSRRTTGGSGRGMGLPKLGTGRKGGATGGGGVSRGKRSGLGGVASGARKSAAAKAAGIAAARKALPTSPTERRKAQVAARRARVEAAAQKRTQAAAAKRVAKARAATGSNPGTGSKAGGSSRGKRLGFGLPKLGGLGGSKATGRTTGRKSPHAQMARAHKKNQAANARAAKASKKRANRAHKTDQRRSNAINDARHKRRAGGKGPTRAISSNGKAAQLARRRARAAVWAAGLATAAVIGARSKRAGRSLRDYYNDTRTHLLGGAALLNGLDQAEAYNAQHGIRPIPDVPANLVHKRTPLAISGGTSQSGVNLMSNPFNLLPEAQDMLTKIQRAELTGALNVVYGFDQLPQAVQAMSDSWVVMAQRAADEMPFHPEVSAALENVHRAFAAAVKAAEEVGPITRKMHAADIDRLENQRRNERAWDVDNNQ